MSEEKTFSDSIKSIGDQIAGLTLKDAVDLGLILHADGEHRHSIFIPFYFFRNADDHPQASATR